MTISEVVTGTKLTKKAIRYYESEDLITSTVLENGYRDYSKEDLDKLIIIKILRDLSFSIKEIKSCLSDEKTLQSSFSLKSAQLQEDKNQLSRTIDFLNTFISQERTLSNLPEFQEDLVQLIENRPRQLRDHLQQVFPGDFGEIIAAAYGQFLDEIIETREQKDAWDALIHALDELEPFEIPQDLVVWAKNINTNGDELKNNAMRLKQEYSQTYEEFNENKKEAIHEYLDQSESRPELYTNQEVLLFLSKECRAAVDILGRYLPLVSRSYEQFFLKQSRFLQDNAELIGELHVFAT